MVKVKQVRSDNTSNKILEAACKIFPELGFAGTSISMLAKDAKINQSLIYHHFGSKEELWKATKGYLLRDVFDAGHDDSHSLDDFVRDSVRTRFDWYLKHPEVIRMVNWQRLEPKRKQLQGTSPMSVDSWVKIIPRMQKDGKIRADLPAEMIIVMMGNIIIAPMLDEHRFLQSRESCEKYIAVITEALLFVLKPSVIA